MLLIAGWELPALLPMSQAIPLMRQAFTLISNGQASVAERQALDVSSGTGLLMGAAQDKQGIVAKLVSVMPENLQKNLPGSIGLLLLMDADNGSPLALMDGSVLTAIRTAALNAVAVDLLARSDSRSALLIGCGTQASAQLEGLCNVRDLRQIRVLGRDADRAAEFVKNHQLTVKAELVVAGNTEAVAKDTGIIVGATNSVTPVIPGDSVPAGCHVSGIGSFKQGMCEFDNELLAKSSIFVESRKTAMDEAGELIQAVEQGVSRQSEWNEIGEVIAGQRPGRKAATEITYFKSVGHAVFDLLAARAAWEAAKQQGAGQEWQQ